jgi:hypothetical protein
MKNKNIALIVIASILLSGCSGTVNGIHKSWNSMTSGNYHIMVYSGPTMIREYHIKNSYINSEVHTDGWFFFTNDGKLVRVSGTVVIEQE